MPNADKDKEIFELIRRCEPLQQELKKIVDDFMEENRRKRGMLK